MYLLYSFLLAIGFLIMLPAFLMRREKYASGFKERLGNYPEFKHDGRKVIWLHCVSVGETYAARPLVDELRETFPAHRLVVSTTTKTGQELAQNIFKDKADAVVYFPFDFKFAVRKALTRFKPSLVLLMETEIWPRFIREAKASGAKIAIVNGRLSERSASRYKQVGPFISRVLQDIDLALMQGSNDADRLISLGMPSAKTIVTGNLKFDVGTTEADTVTTETLRDRFGFDGKRPLIVAASTHDPEERWILEAFCSAASGAKPAPRLVIAPRHPERFDAVAKLIAEFRTDPTNEWRPYSFVRRSTAETENTIADIVLLDTIGELRSIYPLAEIVFVGGSLIPHGGQSILEPAAAGAAIITGHHTQNFADAITTFHANRALIQLPELAPEKIVDELFDQLSDLLEDPTRRRELARNAQAVMKANRGATNQTTNELRKLI
ncbi:MAG: 3-deoxy-D-manno-octulosonic acid transferase [bacterium]|nr:3-deoxy-D-manno-octulosonic acid transferase [bacterium]